MEETFSQNFKRIFLLSFTKELILHSAEREMMKLQNIIESKEQKRKEKSLGEPIQIFTREIEETNLPVQKIYKRPIWIQPIKEPQVWIQPIRKPIVMEIGPKPLPKPVIEQTAIRPLFIPEPKIAIRPLFIPEVKIPQHLEYLKPIPAREVEIDLFKLNLLIRDSAVRIIEVNPDERVIVTGTMGTMPTAIILNKEDIDRVIDKFSEFSKIPANEGIYKVVVGNLIFSAIISETVGSRFIIKKMINPNPFENQPQKYLALPLPLNKKFFLEHE